MNRLPLIFLLAVAARVATAQEAAPLPVSVSVGWGQIYYNHPEGTGGSQSGRRFGGSVSIPVSRHWSVGISAGSWVRKIAESADSHDLLASLSEADLYHLFAQRFQRLGSLRLFVRTGAGLARTASLVGAGATIQQVEHSRLSVSGSAGVDVYLMSHVYLSPGLAYTQILSTDPTIRELSHAYQFGLALTLK